MENQSNEQALYEAAKKRVKFKEHLGMYIAINGILWLIWLFTNSEESGRMPWPAWTTIGWGIGLIFSYAKAYKKPMNEAIESEVRKMKNQ